MDKEDATNKDVSNEKRGRSTSPRKAIIDVNHREGNRSKIINDGEGDRGRSATKRESKSPHGRGKSETRRESRSRSRGRSKSPSKFAEDSFKDKKNTMDIKKRQSAIAKVRGLKLEPSEWTRQELTEKLSKFAHYHQDKKANRGEIIIENKRLLSDDVAVFMETMRRFTEIQSVRMNGCSLNDDVLANLIEGLKNLRHLKELSLVSNLITAVSVRLLIKSFSKLSRKIEILDLRSNSLLTYEDGCDLYKAFSTVKMLNGFNLEVFNKQFNELTLDLSNLNIRLCETGILCSLLLVMIHITELNVSRNMINSKCLRCLVDCLMNRPRIITLNLSHNPLTNDGTDFIGLDHLVQHLRLSHQFANVYLDGIDHITPKTQIYITQSQQVNRSVKGCSDGTYFSKFVTAHIEKKTAIKDALNKNSIEINKKQLANWIPKYDTIDHDFVKKNRIPDMTVSVEGDDILLKRQYVPKNDQYTFEY